jgi:hypothetical protein
LCAKRIDVTVLNRFQIQGNRYTCSVQIYSIDFSKFLHIFFNKMSGRYQTY